VSKLDSCPWYLDNLAQLAVSTPVGVHYLASPIIGQPAAAASGQLVSCIAGDLGAIEYVKPILGTIGRATIVVGKDVSQGKSKHVTCDRQDSLEDEATCEYDAL